MNITEAFDELRSNHPKLSAITSLSEMKNELIKAGYIESWSKGVVFDPRVTSGGINTPVVPVEPTGTSSSTEKALLKQAENPLGDPNKV